MEDKEKDNAAEVTPAEETKPETAPVTEEETKQPKESEPKTVPAEKAAKKGYLERYPENRIFHVTSDGMVFLEKDLSLARLHQRSLGGEGEVESITVNN